MIVLKIHNNVLCIYQKSVLGSIYYMLDIWGARKIGHRNAYYLLAHLIRMKVVITTL